MKKKNNLVLTLCLLVAVVALGIGYALSTQELVIKGTAKTTAIDEAFNVKFTNVTVANDTNTTAKIDANDNTNRTASMTVALQNVGDSESATFTITNASQAGIAAKISPRNVKIYTDGDKSATYSSNFFDVKVTGLEETTTIPSVSNNTKEFTVTVTLKKAFAGVTGNTLEENFYIALEGIEAIQE